MKIAITGGTGFVGRNIARALIADGHSVVLVARGHDHTDPTIHNLSGATFVPIGLDDIDKLARAFAGCEAVVHCAGINREIGGVTYRRVHVDGTRNVVEAAHRAGVAKIALISFLRARPACRSGYHESKWAAEEIIRNSGLDYTVFKCGVIYGKGDHMLDHLSHAFYTFPVFAFVGFRDKPIRPTAVEDVARVVIASLVDGALSNQTVAVLGPEEMTLRQAVRRVAHTVGKRPFMFPMPLWFHYILGRLIEHIMKTPMVSVAQVRMLSEGLAEPSPKCATLPTELAPKIAFSADQIGKGLPAPGPFRLRDLRCCCSREAAPHHPHLHRAFFEMP
ncbi:MAG TPA: NAD(P)H-binding protein [Verrucomicrobiae bacterium]|nr:NAD(P)H-binding protein [Verrucomicrobiae bacterium]